MQLCNVEVILGKGFAQALLLRFVCTCAKFNETFDIIAKSSLTITKNRQIAAFKVHIF